ncbi:hypothetical protein KUTeg_000321 [Tegillarca granosa]|uniref:Uncharacterized protein n=1 Tax=Tegillarca granosa TaxID=220873 RepID=A0ABQ9FZZ5_TEGGR|nr:hypothetical protein KUTeg_000321 [Tegillarca granosa]
MEGEEDVENKSPEVRLVVKLFPKVLELDITKFKQRHKYLVSLGRAQYDPTIENYISPLKLCVGGDDEFCENVHICIYTELYLHRNKHPQTSKSGKTNLSTGASMYEFSFQQINKIIHNMSSLYTDKLDSMKFSAIYELKCKFYLQMINFFPIHAIPCMCKLVKLFYKMEIRFHSK